MAERRKLSEEEMADLVAYLDGEADPETARAVEAKLSLDPTVRAEAEALRRTYDLLDYLPRPQPSTDFTNKTLDRISALRPGARANAGRRGLFGLAWAAAVLVAALAGFGGARLATPVGKPIPTEPAELDQQLVHDLRIIENKRLYDVADDLDFVRALAEPDLFGEDS